MIQLLKDTGTSNTTSCLNYNVSFTYPAGYNTKPEYGFPTTIEHLLLQKSNGTFELLLWNDASSAANAENITNDQITLNVPDYVTILEFTQTPEPSPIACLALGAAGLMLKRPKQQSRYGQPRLAPIN
jgi:hypothetical protein